MRIIALGDTHGRSFWKYIVNTQQFDLLILIGDYWDSFDIPFKDQYQNFLDICQYKIDNPDKIKLLIGNHDFHYTPTAAMFGDHYSGYQRAHAQTIGHALATNKHLLQMAYSWNNYLFTHAGVTKTWLQQNKWNGKQDVEEFINDQWQFKPVSFCFNGRDPYGDDVTQSPIWVRPQSLNEDAIPDRIQVVGHTGQDRIGTEPTEFIDGGSGLFIDTLGRSGEYLVIEDGNIKIEKL